MAIDGLDVYNTIHDAGSWDWWSAGTLRKKGAGDYDISVVEVYDESEVNRNDFYYGEAPQGWTGEAYIIFKVVTVDGTAFFKKLGTISSYMAVSWDGKFLPVVPRETKVVKYVFE